MPERRKLINLGLPKGVGQTASGHLRYRSPKELRGEYVHRQVIKKCIEETPYSVRLLLPWPYEVHHQDYNKQHNCPGNLLIVSDSLHSAMTAHRLKKRSFQAKWSKAPDWWLFNIDEDVPF